MLLACITVSEPSIDTDWYYRAVDGTEFGPYTTAEVRRYAVEGRIVGEGSLRAADSDTWAPASGVLARLTGEPPAVPPTARPSRMAGASNVSQIAYVLCGLLPGAILSIFGIHNLMAGYGGKGAVQLAMSLVLVWGMGCLGFLTAGATMCVAVFAWLGLLIWTIVEVCTVKTDAKGRPFAS